MDNWGNRKKEIYNDLIFCQELMNRLIKTAEDMKNAKQFWFDKHTVVEHDIIRLRRELNNVRIKCDPYYEEDGD